MFLHVLKANRSKNKSGRFLTISCGQALETPPSLWYIPPNFYVAQRVIAFMGVKILYLFHLIVKEILCILKDQICSYIYVYDLYLFYQSILVSSERRVKIGDFGLARDIYKNDYYR